MDWLAYYDYNDTVAGFIPKSSVVRVIIHGYSDDGGFILKGCDHKGLEWKLCPTTTYPKALEEFEHLFEKNQHHANT